MTNASNAAIPTSKRFFPGLLLLLGVNRYDQVLARYRKLYSSFDLPENPALKRHLVEGILPGLAFYQVLRENGETPESAVAYIDQAFVYLFSENITKMKRLGRLPFIYPILRLVIKPAMRQYPPAGWDLEWLQNDSAAVRFNMKSCFYFDTLSRLGAPELTACFCRVDDLIYGDMSPAIRWQRTKTIARGNELCDFCFARA
jgi:hypothetical protein